jgi:hypothetical protein
VGACRPTTVLSSPTTTGSGFLVLVKEVGLMESPWTVLGVQV